MLARRCQLTLGLLLLCQGSIAVPRPHSVAMPAPAQARSDDFLSTFLDSVLRVDQATTQPTMADGSAPAPQDALPLADGSSAHAAKPAAAPAAAAQSM